MTSPTAPPEEICPHCGHGCMGSSWPLWSVERLANCVANLREDLQAAQAATFEEAARIADTGYDCICAAKIRERAGRKE